MRLGNASETEIAEASDKLVAAVVKELEPHIQDAAPFFGGSKKLTLAEVCEIFCSRCSFGILEVAESSYSRTCSKNWHEASNIETSSKPLFFSSRESCIILDVPHIISQGVARK